MKPKEKEIPKVVAKLIEGQLVLDCPFCNKKHRHGASFGFRIAHCKPPKPKVSRKYPLRGLLQQPKFIPKTYELVPEDETDNVTI